jgi:hypothetical protein
MSRLSLIALTLLLAPPALALSAQENPQIVRLFQELQVPETTQKAADQLLDLGKSDPQIRSYLATHLPTLIQQGPSDPMVPWLNAVHLAGGLQIAEAAQALAQWIRVTTGGTLTLGQWAKLEYNPAAKALAQIGDPALDSLQGILHQGDRTEREMAVQTLSMIGSPKAKAVLSRHEALEPDPNLRKFIQKSLEVWKQRAT